jgi:hypothetical protein
MKTTTTELVSIRITDVKPLDARFVQIVSEYLDRIHDRITTKPYPHHVRLLAARPPFISNTQIQVIRAAFPTSHVDQTPLPRWIRDSVILWDRELVELEELRRSSLAINV